MTSSTTAAAFLGELRSATSASHQRLHHHPMLGQLLSEGLDLSAYRRILESFYGFYRPLEQHLVQAASSLAEDTGWAGPLRSGWLEHDLVSLGHRPWNVRNLPTCHERFVLSRPSDLWGTLYVIEGSTLGGQVIARRLVELHGPDMTPACHFFFSYGREVSSRWSVFLARLCNRARSEWFRLATIEAACRLFATLERWLDADMALMESRGRDRSR